jgi:hypothetical protein
MSDGCKASNALTISENAKAGARRARALATCVNSQCTPRLNFVPTNMVAKGGGSHRGIIKIGQN